MNTVRVGIRKLYKVRDCTLIGGNEHFQEWKVAQIGFSIYLGRSPRYGAFVFSLSDRFLSGSDPTAITPTYYKTIAEAPFAGRLLTEAYCWQDISEGLEKVRMVHGNLVVMNRARYSTDLTDAQWALLEPFFPAVDRPDKRNGRPRKYSYREILNGIFYITRAGCVWSLMPHDLPPWLLCHKYFLRWSKSGLWEKIHAALREADRERAGRQPTPSAAVMDSQSVKTTEKGGDAVKTTSAMTNTRTL